MLFLYFHGKKDNNLSILSFSFYFLNHILYDKEYDLSYESVPLLFTIVVILFNTNYAFSLYITFSFVIIMKIRFWTN